MENHPVVKGIRTSEPMAGSIGGIPEEERARGIFSAFMKVHLSLIQRPDVASLDMPEVDFHLLQQCGIVVHKDSSQLKYPCK